jgi:peptidoglycan hydrolase-like protein with peptidoglycan-binding domain
MNEPTTTSATEPTTGRRRRITARALTVLALLASPFVIAAAPASASTPGCNYVMSIYEGTDIYETVPAYASGDYRTWRCQMGYGAGFNGMNYAVQNLQDTMNLCYKGVIGDRWPLSTDGSFGNNTKTALIRVQRSLGISADGTYGPQTAWAMKHWTTAKTPYGYFYVCDRIPG